MNLKEYRLDVPQVTLLADTLRKQWSGYSGRNSDERKSWWKHYVD